MVERYWMVLRSYVRPAGWVPLIALSLTLCQELSCYSSVTAESWAESRTSGSYLLLGIVFATFLGWHVKEQVASPRAILVPRYRTTQLISAVILFAGLVLILALRLWFGGASLAVSLACLLLFMALSVWAGHFPRFAILPALIMVNLSISPGVIQWMLDIHTPTVGAAVIAGVLMLWYWIRRLANMSEEAYEYHHRIFLQSEAADEERRFNTRAPEMWPRTVRQLQRLDGYAGNGVINRVRLWRLGSDPSTVNHLMGIITLLVVCNLITLVTGVPRNEHGIPFPVNYILTILFISYFPVMSAYRFTTRPLGYESLRPQTRPRFVLEMMLTGATDMLLDWLVLIIAGAVLVTIRERALLSVPDLLAGFFLAVAGNALGLGTALWLSRFRGSVVGALPPIVFGAGFFLVFMVYREILSYVWYWAIAAALIVVIGVLLSRHAYHMWCEKELG